ncbi:histidine kinase, partial [Actinosynnema sp.]|uniref:histidine kinase n=1 Tax=Actinosynnema sp. TaxID=1872144 RepID=UPI003F872A93
MLAGDPARTTERNRIAREMHDVLARRISLVAMQAAVLGHRADLRAEDGAELARDIAEGSRQALEELRDVLGVLRACPGGDLGPARAPSLERVPELVVVAEAADGDAAVARERPDVVLVDARMPGRDGLSATAEVLTRPDPPAVLVLTTFDSDE